MRVLAMIQARMGSRRLPGKSLRLVAGQPMLYRVAERVAMAEGLTEMVVATTDRPEDDEIEQRCREWGVAVHRGHPTDVLNRFATAARLRNADLVIRVCGDCPLIEPRGIERLIEQAGPMPRRDYFGYCRMDGRPSILTGLGLYAEAIAGDALGRADETLTDRYDREHVTAGIYTRPDMFRQRWLPAADYDPRLRLTVDTPGDLDVIGSVCAWLPSPTATAREIAEVVGDHPEWLKAMAVEGQRCPKGSRAPTVRTKENTAA